MHKLLFLIITFSVFLGAGCTTSEPLDDVQDNTENLTENMLNDSEDSPADEDYDLDAHITNPDTDWGTEITNDIDSALIGTWKLESLTVQGTETNFKGHTLTVHSDGTMVMDYSTEYYNGPAFGSECTFTGIVNALFKNSSDYNLDYDGENITNEFFEYIEIKKLSGGPTITCEGTQQTFPNVTLGVGPSTDGFVKYEYYVDSSWNNMSITNTYINSTFNYKLITP